MASSRIDGGGAGRTDLVQDWGSHASGVIFVWAPDESGCWIPTWRVLQVVSPRIRESWIERHMAKCPVAPKATWTSDLRYRRGSWELARVRLYTATGLLLEEGMGASKRMRDTPVGPL